MAKKSELTQQRITETARELFIEKGFEGVRMQELADSAGVNKGLLHHYFNNKQTLFDEVFTHALEQLFGKIMQTFTSEASFEEKIRTIVDAYFDMLHANPRLPVFLVFEINRDETHASLFHKILTEQRVDGLIAGIRKNDPDITEQDAINIMLTVVSLSVFPFMAKPIVMKMVKDEKNYAKLIEERREITKLLVTNLVKSL